MFFNAIYFISVKAVKVYYKLFYRFTVEGMEHLPKTGGGVIAANHRSNNDPPVIASMIDRQISFAAKKELFQNPVAKWYLTKVGAVPISRGDTEVSTFKHFLRMMKEGKLTLIFPSGTRKKVPLEKVKDGAVVIASRSGVPVIPMAVIGDYKFFHKHKLVIGEPIYYDKLTSEEAHQNSMKLLQKIYEMAGDSE